MELEFNEEQQRELNLVPRPCCQFDVLMPTVRRTPPTPDPSHTAIHETLHRTRNGTTLDGSIIIPKFSRLGIQF
ncbi:hypothetical protein ACLKA7_007081 [Drosophila subpalustris]